MQSCTASAGNATVYDENMSIPNIRNFYSLQLSTAEVVKNHVNTCRYPASHVLNMKSIYHWDSITFCCMVSIPHYIILIICSYIALTA